MDLKIFLFRISVALVVGLLIGIERQLHHKMAGVRTNALTAVGSATFVLLSILVTPHAQDVHIIAQIVTGIGFLGAGIIFKEGVSVHGLTTSVTIWCSSAIGCLAGTGYTIEALCAAGVVVFINAALKPIDEWLDKRNNDEQ